MKSSPPITVRLQPHNGLYSGEFEIRSSLDDELKEHLALNSVLVSCCITTNHHNTRAQAKHAVKKILRELSQILAAEVDK